ncbi:MAG: hypothetical protein EXR75_13540, partial [Myxococcales bacterium]|nr:hypothetical protein [Myxococcales bacterium]
MSRLSDGQIDDIARQLLERMASGDAAPRLSAGASASVARGGALPSGVFRSIDECVAAARAAFQAFQNV